MAQTATDVLSPSGGSDHLSVSPKYAQELGNVTEEYKTLESERADLKPPPPMEPVPPFKPQQTSPDQMWGSAAMMLAAIGSLFTRRPLVTALNAASATLQAFHKGDMDAAQQGFQAWKAASENYLKLKNYELESYKAMSAKYSGDANEFWSHIRAIAAENNDPTMLEIAIHRDNQRFTALMLENERLMLRMAEGHDGLNEKAVVFQNYKDIQEARKELSDAQKSGDPKKVQAATDKLKDSLQAARDFAAAEGKASGLSAETGDVSGDVKPAPSNLKKGIDFTTAFGPKSEFFGLGSAAGGLIGTAGEYALMRRKAIDALTRLNVKTIDALRAANPGRYSNMMMEQYQQLLVSPGSLTTAPNEARQKISDTKDLIDDEIQRLDTEVIPTIGGLKPPQQQKILNVKSVLLGLSNDYGNVVDQMDEALEDKKSAPSDDGWVAKAR